MPESPLKQLRNDLGEGVVQLLIVDDIPTLRHGGGGGGAGTVMTDGAGLMSADVSALLPRVSEGNLVGENEGGHALGHQLRLYAQAGDA